MTTRGTNPSSISPPVQIPQQRHVSTISSGTPPPNSQQLFLGQSPGLVQGPAYNYIQQQYPQGEQLLSYQAYGSAPNDLRGAATSAGRGGPGPASMAQSGAYYPQHNQTMRPSQPPPSNQQYYISQGGQNNMRHPRPSHPTPNPVMFLPNNNMVISANMYPPTTRMPMYPQSGPQFQPRYNAPGNLMFFNNGARNPVSMQSQGMGSVPLPREKKFINISDPTTGRNITDEIINSSQQQSTVEKNDQDDAPVVTSDKGVEIRKNFTRQVVERMKTGESVPSPAQPPIEPVNMVPQSVNPSAQHQPSQEHPQQISSYPPGPSQQTPQSTPPLTNAPVPGANPMICPQNMRMPSPPINLHVPPPQLPPSVYNNRHGPTNQAMPNQVQLMHPKGHYLPPVTLVASSARPAEPIVSATHDAQPTPVHVEPATIPHNDIPPQEQSTTTQVSLEGQSDGQFSSVSQESVQLSSNQMPKSSISTNETIVPAPTNIVTGSGKSSDSAPIVPPVSNAEPPPSTSPPASNRVESSPVVDPATATPTVDQKVTAPVVDQKAVAPVMDQKAVAPVVEQKMSAPAEKQPSVVVKQSSIEKEITSSPKEDPSVGASTQANKDGRRGKKNKKDFSRKESGGSEMDAFLDLTGKDSGVDLESKHILTEEHSASEDKFQEKASTPSSVVSLPSEEEVTVKKESSPMPTQKISVDAPEEQVASIEEVKADKYIAEKETEVVKSDQLKIQNGTDLPHDDEVEKDTSVPKTDLTVTSMPDDESQIDEPSDAPKNNNQHELENGEPKVEEVEPSKAEVFAKLKKSGGKLVYDRAYLMELRDCASSQTKPDGLPELEVILDSPNLVLSRPMGAADFIPAFFQTSANQRHAPPIGKSSSRGRQRPGDVPSTPRVIKSLSMSNDSKPLHQSENPWKPIKKEDKDAQQNLEGDMLYIMNRLTPTNFDKMAIEMKGLKVKTYEDLQLMVKIFFDKVTLETKFVEAYAQMCKVMAGLKVAPPPDGSVKENMATFRVVMLTKCQQEFEADKSVVFENPEEKKKKLEDEFPENTPERNEKIEEVLYHMKLKRLKFYGNIRFIGELFKLNMLTENIMHDCIFRLLKAKDNDSLVSLCNLLTTVGSNLDTDKAKQRMDQYFFQMEKIADEQKSRIKFKLLDVIELRQKHWVPRKETTGPKKIDEVHKDFAQEQARNQLLASQPLPPHNDTPVGSRKGSRQRSDDKPNDEGWNTVTSKSVRMIDASKMKISKNVVDDNIQLGPGGGAHKQMWSRGSHGGTQSSQGSNRFSALNDDRRSFPRSPSRVDGSASRGLRQGQTVGHGRGKIIPRSSQDGERREAIANTRSFMGGRSQNSSRENSCNRDDRRQFMGPRSSMERDNPMTRSDSAVRTEEFRVPAPPSVKQMSETEIETKAVNLLEEYLSIRDLDEAKLCVKELSGQNHIHLVVTAGINFVLEKREEARHMTGKLFYELVMDNILTHDIYVKGLNEELQYASDMVVDIPMLWKYLAQVICPLLVGGCLPWAKLKQAFKPYLDNKNGAKLMASILSQCVEKQGEKEVATQWQNSGLNWSNYLEADEINSFVNDKKLGFTLDNSSQSRGVIPDLESMIRNRATNDELEIYIEKSVTGKKTDSSFIRALTTAVVSSSITETKNINKDIFNNHKDLLQKYIGSNVDLQLQALYAIQTLMAKLEHPSGVLTKLFELLYYEISMEEEAFYKWEKCSDPQEQEAKGTCLLQVRQFFIWLRENEEPES